MSTHITIKKGFNYYRYYVMDGTRVVATSGEYATIEQCISSAIADFGELPIPDKTGKFMYDGLDYFDWGVPKMPPGFVGDGITDDYFAFQELVDRAEDGATIYLPGKTDFIISETVKINNKGIEIIGRKGTRILCNKGAFLVDGGGDKCNFKKLSIHSRGGTDYHGIELRRVADMVDVNLINFDGYGVYATADVTAPIPTDVSFCWFQQVNVNGQGHGAGGFYFAGGDASTSMLLHCDARDTKGVGFYDHGFLGNCFIGCQGHANKKGNYRCDDPAAMSGFLFCYGEGDSFSWFGGNSQLIGGCLPFELGDKAIATTWQGVIGTRFPSQYEMSQDILKIKQLLKI